LFFVESSTCHIDYTGELSPPTCTGVD